MGNYNSGLYADVEHFKGIVSSPGRVTSEQHMLENTSLYNHVSGAEESVVWEENVPDLAALKFLHTVPEPRRGKPVRHTHTHTREPVAIAASPAVSSGPALKPRPPPSGPATLQGLRDEIHDMRGELELLKNQHKREITLMMNELDEEKKMRLSLQVEVDRLKKHMSK
ncbi:SH3 domain-containing kinase-binding protein 1-like isoform X1 [Astyanax mexicanus]|uniref:SH3 domain-containing kinase-binding protein 1-like isoform X1 n=1 Tax=Astyanax mexicanus TaxID=7994 RepID=A0A8T2L570_ASTMX|nr:SH3 domain-containing kinase-binding protein 1-like isoform X1 [Astyanax mexicanus]